MSNEFNMASFFEARSEVDFCYSVLQEWLNNEGRKQENICKREAVEKLANKLDVLYMCW